MVKDQSRRNFLWTAPLAAAAALSLTDEALASSVPAGGAHKAGATPVPFQIFTAQQIADDSKALQAAPGNKNLVEFGGGTCRYSVDGGEGEERERV